MYMHTVAHFKIKSITHQFLFTGHTQYVGDNDHLIIEKEAKRHLKSAAIYVPAQYVSRMPCSGLYESHSTYQSVLIFKVSQQLQKSGL